MKPSPEIYGLAILLAEIMVDEWISEQADPDESKPKVKQAQAQHNAL